MKSIRILLSLAAIIFAAGGAMATVLVDITNHGKTFNGSTIYETFERNLCDNDRSSGTQCTLALQGLPLAYKVSDSSAPLYRP